MQRFDEQLLLTRRYFFGKASAGLGVAALAGLLKEDLHAESALPGLPHFAPRAKRIIYLFQSGGPSQMELFDYKPKLKDLEKTELPDSVRMGQRLTGMTSTDDFDADQLSGSAFALSIQPVREIRRVDQRADAPPG
jgi:hypothetical protein